MIPMLTRSFTQFTGKPRASGDDPASTQAVLDGIA